MVPGRRRTTTESGRTQDDSGHGQIGHPTGLPFELEFPRRPGTRLYVGLKRLLKLVQSLVVFVPQDGFGSWCHSHPFLGGKGMIWSDV